MINGSHGGDTPAENINGRVHRAQAASSCPVCINLCPKSTANASGRAKAKTKEERARPGRPECGWVEHQWAKKTGGQFYGFMDIFSGTRGSRKILAKQKSKQTVAAMRWNEWVGNQRLPAHCETRLLCRTTISSCYPVSQKHTHRKRRWGGLDACCHLFYICLWNASNRFSGQTPAVILGGASIKNNHMR